MSKLFHDLADIILRIEAEMRRLGLWQEQRPPNEALESLMPFCHDTLEFHQWLQWVFLPKMKQAIESEMDLPSSSDIYPLAEYSLEKLAQDTWELLALLKRFDRIINDQ